jgi:TRAP transporter TAXI family solute receptor
MRSMRLPTVCVVVVLIARWAGIPGPVNGQSRNSQRAAAKETGYAAKKPVFGGACKTCPWGAIAEIVKAAMQPYGYDVQVCYNCAGVDEVRLVAGAKMPPPLSAVSGLAASLIPPPPNGPVDFGAMGSQFLQSAYLGINDFANDPEGPRKNLRMIANIQEPHYYIVAVKANSGITDLRQIAQKRLPVKMVAWAVGPRQITPAVLAYYNLSKENIESFGGTLASYSRDADVDVLIGFGSLVNAPEYNLWYQATQKYDLKYLELAKDLRAKLAKQFYLEDRNIPLGLFRGVDHPVPTVIQNGTVIYGRTDMPDDFTYTLAKALDEHQDLFQWANGAMNFSYNSHTVWKAFDIPLHPGAARYYKERGYLK